MQHGLLFDEEMAVFAPLTERIPSDSNGLEGRHGLSEGEVSVSRDAIIANDQIHQGIEAIERIFLRKMRAVSH